jgi:hypothetical protein
VGKVIRQVIIILTIFLAVFDDHTPSGRDLKTFSVILGICNASHAWQLSQMS